MSEEPILQLRYCCPHSSRFVDPPMCAATPEGARPAGATGESAESNLWTLSLSLASGPSSPSAPALSTTDRSRSNRLEKHVNFNPRLSSATIFRVPVFARSPVDRAATMRRTIRCMADVWPKAGGYMGSGTPLMDSKSTRVLVTGACGQIGMELVPVLRSDPPPGPPLSL
jgi:hypothetical protein